MPARQLTQAREGRDPPFIEIDVLVTAFEQVTAAQDVAVLKGRQARAERGVECLACLAPDFSAGGVDG